MRPSGCGADCGGRRTRRGRPVDGVADAAVGAVHPRLEVGHGAMGARQQLLAGLGALAARAVVAAELREPVVARPAVSVDDRPGGGGRLRERPQRAARGVGQDLKAKPPRALPADLDRDPAERLLARLAPAPAPFLEPAEVELVDLNLVLQRLTLGRDHRPAQRLQDQPRSLIARQPQLALKLLGRDPRMVGGDQVGGPEPDAQRRARLVHHGARGHRRLLATRRALPQMPALEHPSRPPATPRADEPLRPARGGRVLKARRLAREPLLELHDRAGEVWTRHRRTVEPRPDVTGYALARCSPGRRQRWYKRAVRRDGGSAGISALFAGTAA